MLGVGTEDHHLMEDDPKKKKNSNPLPSIRHRFSSPSPSFQQQHSKNPSNPSRRSTLPFYNSELNSVPVRQPGAVPFVWEHRPGQPVCTATAKIGSSVRTRRPVPVTNARKSRSGSRSPEEKAEVEEVAKEVEMEKNSDVVAVKQEEEAAEKKAAKINVKIIPDWILEEKKEEEVKKSQARNSEENKVEFNKSKEEEEEEEEEFSDARDTLSRSASFTMACSVTGISGMPDFAGFGAGNGGGGGEGGNAMDPGARDFMIGRFLPAAQAVAVGSPQCTFRKANAQTRELARLPVNVEVGQNWPRRQPEPLPYQHLPPNYVVPNGRYGEYEEVEEEEGDDDEEEEEEDEKYDARRFGPMGCGLLPKLCMKSSLFLMNPVPSVKASSRGKGLPPRRRHFQRVESPLARSSQNGGLRQESKGPIEHSSEAVYKHELEQRYHQAQREDERSKATSESNRLSYWSGSLTADGSSPFHRSTGDVASPCHSEGKGSARLAYIEERSRRSSSSGSRGTDGTSLSLTTSDRGSLKGSGSISPTLENTLDDGSMNHQVAADTKGSHLDIISDTKEASNSNKRDSDDAGGESQSVAESYMNQVCENGAQKVIPLPYDSSETLKLDDGRNLKQDVAEDVQPHLEEKRFLKKDLTPLQQMLPLPLPKSPSESWLSRTLPSVSTKKTQVQPKKQTPLSSDRKKDDSIKSSRPHQIRFVEVLEKPTSVNSQM